MSASAPGQPDPILAFRPGPERGAALDSRVRDAFSDSVRLVLEKLASQDLLDARVVPQVVGGIRRYGPPGAIVAYASLVEAIFGERGAEAIDSAQALVQSALSPAASPLRCVTLGDQDLGPGQAERYRRLFDEDQEAPLAIEAVADHDLERAARLADKALALLDAGAPELGGEIRALLREIVFARSGPAATAGRFNGASVFLAWGAVLLNADEMVDRVTMAETLAHETGHSLLSGFTIGKPLVENDPAERYDSPLRVDPRPMDGIVHATYVLARMHYCLDRLLQSGCLTEQEAATVAIALAERRRAFAAGLEVVDRHARFTPIGRAAFEPARQYMADVRA